MNWQKKKLEENHNDWNLFYKNELKKKLKFALIAFSIFFGLSYTIHHNQKRIQEKKIEQKKLNNERKRIEQENLIKKRQEKLQEKQDSSQYYFDIKHLIIKNKSSEVKNKSLLNSKISLLYDKVCAGNFIFFECMYCSRTIFWKNYA